MTAKHLNQSASEGVEAVELPYTSVLSDSTESYSYMTMVLGRKSPW